MKKIVVFLLVITSFLFAREPQEIIDSICSSCHGFNMEKRGYGVSEPPRGLSSSYILSALTKYKKGKKSDYGQGRTMSEQTSTLTVEEIKALSIYIKALGKKKL
jgi:cytochrome c553